MEWVCGDICDWDGSIKNWSWNEELTEDEEWFLETPTNRSWNESQQAHNVI